MIRHFAADGSVKRQWPEGLHASVFELDGKTFAQIQGSNSVVRVDLEAGDQVGEMFTVPAESNATASEAPGARQALTRATPADLLRQLDGAGLQVDHDALQKALEVATEDLSKRAGLTAAMIDKNNIDALPAAAAAELEPLPNSTTEHPIEIPKAEPAAVAEPAAAAPVEISATEVSALNDAIHIVQDVAAHLAHPHAEHGDTIAQAAAAPATPETNADPAAAAPETTHP